MRTWALADRGRLGASVADQSPAGGQGADLAVVTTGGHGSPEDVQTRSVTFAFAGSYEALSVRPSRSMTASEVCGVSHRMSSGSSRRSPVGPGSAPVLKSEQAVAGSEEPARR